MGCTHTAYSAVLFHLPGMATYAYTRRGLPTSIAGAYVLTQPSGPTTRATVLTTDLPQSRHMEEASWGQSRKYSMYPQTPLVHRGPLDAEGAEVPPRVWT